MKCFKRCVALLVLGTMLLTGSVAGAVDLKDILGDVVGVVAGGYAISAIAGPLNDFINTITLNKGVKANGSTAVVPIVSLGQGTHIGAAQVTGPSNAINSTKAVAQIEASYRSMRVRILVPVDSSNPIERFRRVQGVGVSAIIDLKL
ncbi:MAG TPA: hypothetical protein PLW97_07040 [Synergistaceae bacterium]|nr:hypothetical protein [Synergistaceae bacterium]HPQ37386.1 hypothetical protein [Synergistaceae bacterium]